VKERQFDVIVVGAGLAGLSCSVLLTESGLKIALLEATDRVGGRVRTDVVDGFTLDHGFQVLLTAYPACQRLLDYNSLRLCAFDPGALIRQRGKFRTLGDPWRRPFQALATALNPVGTLRDKLSIAKLRRESQRGSLEDLYNRESVPTLQRLQEAGFSTTIIEQFFRPFIGGVFLDESLSASSRLLEFVFRMFACGDIAVPADGMAAIPRQLAERLPQGTLQLNKSVASIEQHHVHLTDGTSLSADNVVVATESCTAARLLGIDALDTAWNQATTIYYAAADPPVRQKMLMLRGDERGPIQTATVLSNIAPQYAPRGQSLVSVSLAAASELGSVDVDAIDSAVRLQLHQWFGPNVDDWRRLGVYRVPFALPARPLDPVLRSIDAGDYGGTLGFYICGDHCETPSIQGAMNSGIRVAESILRSK
jgi:phytoene dehydrogenase-like protein